MEKIFYKDNIEGIEVSYQQMLNDLALQDSYSIYCKSNSFYIIFKHIILSLLIGKEAILLDEDFSNEEINKLIGNNKDIFAPKAYIPIGQINFEDIEERISKNKSSWKITMFTSGTTGLPKKISHNYESISRSIKIEDNRKENIWGFSYNPTHMAGVQVFFQAFLNQNTIVRLFGVNRVESLNLIKDCEITNISATPTFYRLLLPADHICISVKNLTSGGEKFDSKTLQRLNQMFPNSRIRNIYASTEAGALFASEGDVFSVKSEIAHLIKFFENELYIHKSLIGQSEGLKILDGWYQTGDLIEIISKKPNTFRFVSRKNEMINTGGYKVNPLEVEDVIRLCEGVTDVLVFAKKNSLLGNLVICEVVRHNELLTEKQIRFFLQDKLQEFKIPRIIKFVESLKITRTGKIIRKK
ncbi:MAG: AMP-binding protein [Flavobacteriaceae bacterium]